jgi:ubiquitin carboxyl-terminal hydrolase 44/49
MDLSLEFPDWCQPHLFGARSSTVACHIEGLKIFLLLFIPAFFNSFLAEMLRKFTEVERLEGKIYSCEQCNREHIVNTVIFYVCAICSLIGKRRRASLQPTKYSEAQKQLTLWRLPHVLRLHLKRFM